MGLGLDQPSHWAVIAVVALLLFGYKKLPEMARSAGKSMRIFKTELKGMAGDDEVRAKAGQDVSEAEADALKQAQLKAAELKAAEDKAAALRAELIAAEEKAAILKVAEAPTTATPVSADGVTPRAS